MSIKESALPTVTPASTSDYVRMVTSSGASRKSYLGNFAKWIVETYASSTLAGVAQSIKEAIDTINNRTANIGAYKTGVSFDTLKSTGMYYCEAMTDRPSTTYSAYILFVVGNSAGTVVKQIAYPVSGEAYWYARHYSGSVWGTWKQTAA